MRARGVLATAASITVVAFTIGNADNANGTEAGGAGHQYAVTNDMESLAETPLSYGHPQDEVYVGDFNGDGRDTLAIRRGNTIHVRNDLSDGPPEVSFHLGEAGDVYLVGDWDGDGVDTFAIRRGSEYRIFNSLVPGEAPDRIITFGLEGETVLVGDFNGDGRDTLASVYGPIYAIKQDLATGVGGYNVRFGRFGSQPIVGDWDGDGIDTLAFRRSTTYNISDGNPDISDQQVSYGSSSDAVLVGDWDGDGVDTLGRRKASYEVEQAEVRTDDVLEIAQGGGGTGAFGFMDKVEDWAGSAMEWLKSR